MRTHRFILVASALTLSLQPACTASRHPATLAKPQPIRDDFRPASTGRDEVDWDKIAAEAEEHRIEQGRERSRCNSSEFEPITAATFPQSGGTDYEIILNRAFIERYKNRVGLRTPFRVKHTSWHSWSSDGDVHIAGYSDEIGLPVVAELMNWRLDTPASDIVRAADDADSEIQLQGVWRLWCEHPGGIQIQYAPVPEITNSNPDHVFELHPLTKVADRDVAASTLKPIQNYETKDAAAAFKLYDKLPCQLTPDSTDETCSIVTKKIGYNYVEFMARIEEDMQFETIDGRFVRARPLDLSGNPVSQRTVRLVFPLNSDGETYVRSLHAGDTIHVLGTPRIDLAVVSWRLRNAVSQPEALSWKLPYEIIVVAKYP